MLQWGRNIPLVSFVHFHIWRQYHTVPPTRQQVKSFPVSRQWINTSVSLHRQGLTTIKCASSVFSFYSCHLRWGRAVDCHDQHRVRSSNVHSTGCQHSCSDDWHRPHSKSIQQQGGQKKNSTIFQRDELISQCFPRINLYENVLLLQLNHLEDYMTFMKLPKQLRIRISNYFQARYGGKWYDEKDVLNWVSSSIKEVAFSPY